MDIVTLAIAKKYVDNSLAGAGAVAGKPCQIQSITDITGGHRITFLWVDDNNVSHTSTLDVMDGVDGDSPTVAVTDITGGHKVTITDKNGDHEFNVMDGQQGEQGEQGEQGPSGEGVPSGGTTGQILKKKSGTDYDTEWADNQDLSGLMPKVSPAVVGSFASVKSDGTVESSGSDATSFRSSKPNYIHISFDDVTTCIGNLITNKSTYESLYDEPFFAFLKNLHDTYGARFSLYVFADTFANLDDTYKDELYAARKWLKFGIHAPSSSTSFRFGSGRASATTPADYNLLSKEAVTTIWEEFVDHVALISGSYESVDRMPRLHYYAAPLSVCRAMQRAKCGALGFLSADDDRVYNYWFEQQSVYQEVYATRPDVIYDEVTDCVLVPTDFRGEWLDPNYSDTNNYDEPTEDNVYDELVVRNANAKYQDTFRSLIWFTHEWQIYNGTEINAKGQWVIDACRFAVDYGFAFDYPQYNVGKECKRKSSNQVCFMTENVPTRDWSYRQLYTLPMVANKLNPIEGKPLIQFSQAGTEGYITPSIGRAVYEVVFRIPTTDNTKRLLIDMNEINAKFPSDNVSFGIIQWCAEEVLMPKYSSVSRYYTDSVNSDAYKIKNSGKWLYTKSDGTSESDTVLDTVEIGGRTYAYFDLDDNCGYITVSAKRNYAGDLNYTMEQTMSLNRILSFTTVPKP